MNDIPPGYVTIQRRIYSNVTTEERKTFVESLSLDGWLMDISPEKNPEQVDTSIGQEQTWTIDCLRQVIMVDDKPVAYMVLQN